MQYSAWQDVPRVMFHLQQVIYLIIPMGNLHISKKQFDIIIPTFIFLTILAMNDATVSHGIPTKVKYQFGELHCSLHRAEST